jgi:hypothetical protein
MFFADDCYRYATFPEFNGSFDLGSIAAMEPLIIADAAHHQVVDLLAD